MNITSTFLDKLSNTGKLNFITKKTAGSVNIENDDLLYRTLLGNLKNDRDYLEYIYSQFPEIILIDCTENLKNDEIQQIRNWRDPDPQKQEDKKLYRKFNSLVRKLLRLTQYEIGFSQTTNEVTFDLDGMIRMDQAGTKDDRREVAFARRAQAPDESQAAVGYVRLIRMGYDGRIEQGCRGDGVFHREIGTDQQPT